MAHWSEADQWAIFMSSRQNLRLGRFWAMSPSGRREFRDCCDHSRVEGVADCLSARVEVDKLGRARDADAFSSTEIGHAAHPPSIEVEGRIGHMEPHPARNGGQGDLEGGCARADRQAAQPAEASVRSDSRPIRHRRSQVANYVQAGSVYLIK